MIGLQHTWTKCGLSKFTSLLSTIWTGMAYKPVSCLKVFLLPCHLNHHSKQAYNKIFVDPIWGWIKMFYSKSPFWGAPWFKQQTKRKTMVQFTGVYTNPVQKFWPGILTETNLSGKHTIEFPSFHWVFVQTRTVIIIQEILYSMK